MTPQALSASATARKPVKTIVKHSTPAVDSIAITGGLAACAPLTNQIAAREAQEAATCAASFIRDCAPKRLLPANCEAASTGQILVRGSCDKTVHAAEAQTAPPPVSRDELTVAMFHPGSSPSTRHSLPEQSASLAQREVLSQAESPALGTLACVACAGKHRPHTCGKALRTVGRTKPSSLTVKRSLSEIVAAEMVAAVDRSSVGSSGSRRPPVDRTEAREAQEQEEEAKKARALQRQAEQAELLKGAAHVLQGLLMS